MRRPALSAAALNQVAAGDAATPAAHSTVRAAAALAVDGNTGGIDLINSTSEVNFNPKPFKRALRDARKTLRKARQQARRGLNQYHPRLHRVESAKLVFQSKARQFRNRTGKLNARWAAADDQEGQ